MKKSIFLDSLKLIAIFGAIWLAFTFISLPKVDTEVLEVSVDNEERLGNLIVDEILLNNKEIQLNNNETIDSVIQIISNRLINSIDKTDYQYKIRVINDPQVNAFTLPGGNIFVYTGLIQFSESPEEVAAVIAHELGHAEKKHVIQRLAKELGISIIFSAITGADALLISELGKTAASTIFDRKQEKEADDFSFSLMEKAGISPASLGFFFRRVNMKQQDNADIEFLATHPNNNSRIKASLEYKTSKSFKPEKFNFNWKVFKNNIN